MYAAAAATDKSEAEWSTAIAQVVPEVANSVPESLSEDRHVDAEVEATSDTPIEQVESVGYHERVRGLWGWPEMGGWVFGFANDPTAHGDDPPPTALVFTLIQPPHPADATTGSVMLWRHGRMRRHFPRRCVEVAVRGLLDRDKITQVPELARLFGVAPMAPIPQRLVISARSGDDWVLLDFECETAARIVIPNETGIAPYSVHEVIGPCKIEGRCGSDSFAFSFYGIVEFAGGARAD